MSEEVFSSVARQFENKIWLGYFPKALMYCWEHEAAAGEVSISLLRDNLVGVSCAVAACALTAAVYMFLPGSALVAEDEAGHLDDESLAKRESAPSPDMNVEDVSRRIWIFTTASLPWMTGTAVNPLLRAAYLTRGREKGKVTLGVPWLEESDQHLIFPKDKRFSKSEEQAAFVREWLVKAGLEKESENLDFLFYPSRYHAAYGSIFPMGDLCAMVADEEADICVLEEPEHLNFFRAEGVPWLKKFRYVVGIIHTNYMFYARGETGGVVKKPIVRAACAFTVRAHCHRIIKLSGALQDYAKEKELVENVHGVRSQFLDIGENVSVEQKFTSNAYFIGKVLWSKGIDILLALMDHARSRDEGTFPIDMYGSGSDLGEVKERVSEMELPVTFYDAIDHAKLSQYKIFVNPSRSEVLCTTIAEALAMGKWVVCARHPSNDFFFENFESCLSFTDEQEFLLCMQKAFAEDPPRLSAETRNMLSWSAATERFLAAASLPEIPGRSGVSRSARGLARLDKVLASFHQKAMKGRRGDIIRTALGGGPVARQVRNGTTEDNNGTAAAVSFEDVEDDQEALEEREAEDTESSS